jgi:spore germination cell wall hydrolase CwlJ-like protein
MKQLPPSAFELAPRQPRPASAQHRAARRWLRPVLVLGAAIGVPALAAPEAWQGLSIGDAQSGEVRIEPMPFERPGESFPGAAFYYLASEESLAPQARSDAGSPTAIARALRIDLSGIDRTRALQCLTAAIYYEAASEPDQGQRAVAQVVLNRVAHPSYPKTVCGVVYQGSERITGCQFSFTCDGSLARRPSQFFWRRAEDVARAALGGYVEPSVGLATHYHTIAVHPYWASSLVQLATIGAHRFYRFGGPAGMSGAFRFAYGGGEPIAAPHPRDAAAGLAPDPALDPLAVQKAFEATYKAPQTGEPSISVQQAAAHRGATPSYAPEVQQRGGEALYRGERLPEATGVRPEYQNSGKWIVRPGS